MWPPIGIWEPLLRFIGVGILRTWGIIHGKASLSGPVYKMRQAWQRWRPSTTGPSCLNMGLSHLTYPWHQLQPFSISQKNTQASWRLTQFCTAPSTVVSFYHRTGSRFSVMSGIEKCGLAFQRYDFLSQNTTKKYDFSFYVCRSITPPTYLCVVSVNLYSLRSPTLGIQCMVMNLFTDG